MKSMTYKNVLGITVLVDYVKDNSGITLKGLYLFGCNRLNRLSEKEQLYIECLISSECGVNHV